MRTTTDWSCTSPTTTRDIPAGSLSNSFRMHFNSRLRILSIHYYDSPYFHVDCSGLKLLQKYVDSNVVGNTHVAVLTTSRVCLRRNAKRKDRNMLIRQKITHKAVPPTFTTR